MTITRSMYWSVIIPKDEAESKLASAVADLEAIENSTIDPNLTAQSQTVSAGSGSKSITFRTVEERERQHALALDKVHALQWQCGYRSGRPGEIIRREVRIV